MAALDEAFFAAAEPLARDVTLPDGSVHRLHFRQLPAATFRKHFRQLDGDDEARQAQGMAGLIAASLCEADGSPAITPEQAALLKPAAERAIFEAILDANGMAARGKAQPPAAPNDGSGTS